jgi:hypothetical protein
MTSTYPRPTTTDLTGAGPGWVAGPALAAPRARASRVRALTDSLERN